jgi:hypothetical protein
LAAEPLAENEHAEARPTEEGTTEEQGATIRGRSDHDCGLRLAPCQCGNTTMLRYKDTAVQVGDTRAPKLNSGTRIATAGLIKPDTGKEACTIANRFGGILR